MNIIDEKYISSFLPIQELDQVRINPSTGVADVLSDDLFFMSQLSAYSTNTRNAIAVSKKIRYQDLKELLSSELSIAEINISVDDLSNAINELSTKEINDVSALSDAIILSTDALSIYINNVRDDLSNTVSSNYVTKYEQLCTVIECFDDISNPAKFASKIYLSDGRLTVTDTIDASSLIVPKNWKLSQSGIRADVSRDVTVSADGIQTEIVYPVLSDCYLNCMISAYEQDATDSPLYVYLQTNENNEINRTIIDQLNNPGGYSGLKFYNFYNSSFPIKSWNDTSVIFKYGDNTPFDAKTKINFIEYSFYAVTAKDDLSGYVKKQDPNILSVLSTHKDDTRMQLYAMMINDDGLVKDVSSLYYGVATNDKLGLIKADGLFDDPYYPVKISNDVAYVTTNHATQDAYGTIKLNNTLLMPHPNSIDCGLSVTLNGNGYVPIPSATNENYGVVKTNTKKYTDRTLSSGISAYLQLDSEGHAYVDIPPAGYELYGIIKTGLREDTKMVMSRSVYLDKDGFAKVNVAANYDIGQYYDSPTDKGFDTTILINLNDENRENSSNITENIVEFTGSKTMCLDYGNFTWRHIVNSENDRSFFARAVYEGTSDSSLTDATIQVICDSNVITTIDIGHSQTGNGKRFICSQDLGTFSGNGCEGKHMFAAISNNSSFNDGKLWFLLKYMNKD